MPCTSSSRVYGWCYFSRSPCGARELSGRMPDSQSSEPEFEDWAFSFSPMTPLFTQLYKWVLPIDCGGNVSDLVMARNCCLARMLSGEAELVSEWTGLSGKAKSVKRFERSNGLDTALYKNYLYLSNISYLPESLNLLEASFLVHRAPFFRPKCLPLRGHVTVSTTVTWQQKFIVDGGSSYPWSRFMAGCLANSKTLEGNLYYYWRWQSPVTFKLWYL